MSNVAVNAVRDTQLRGSAKFVLWLLADHHNSNTGRCDPSISTLARESGFSKATIIRALNALDGQGLITRSLSVGQSTKYTLNRLQDETGSTAQPVSPCPPTSLMVTHDPSHGDTQTVIKPEEPKVRGAKAPDSFESTLSDKEWIWKVGPRILGRQHRGVIGKQLNARGEGPVRSALEATRREQPGVPVEYFMACFRPGDAMEEYERNPLAGIAL